MDGVADVGACGVKGNTVNLVPFRTVLGLGRYRCQDPDGEISQRIRD